MENILESHGIKDMQVPTQSSSVAEKAAFLKKLSANETISAKNTYKIFFFVYRPRLSYPFVDSMPKDFQEPMVLLLQKLLDQQELLYFLSCVHYCPKEWQKSLRINKTAYKDILAPFDYDMDKASIYGPFFNSAYFESNIVDFVSASASYFMASSSYELDKISSVKFEHHKLKVFEKISAFATQEYAKGNIIIFHGQNDQWEFFEKIFNALLKIKYGTTAPKDYVRLRFCEKALLSDKEVAEIRRDGITWTTFKKYRPKVLFANLHLIANDAGSNSLAYIFSNSDQTTNKNNIDCNLANTFFTDLDMHNTCNSLHDDPKTQFYNFYHIFKEECDSGYNPEPESRLWLEKLYDLYKKAVVARNNIGRLVAISLPKEVARTLCYKTKSAAPLNPVLINGELTTDIVTIAENYGQVPFHNEYALILSETITNPEKAAAAGIVMKTFTSEPTEESKKYEAEFEAEFAKVMDRIAEMYHARMALEHK